MTNKDRFELNELRDGEIDRIRYCEVCGKPLRLGIPQWAHRIAKSQANIKKYGAMVINHRRNVALVCSLRCNDAVNLGFKTAIAEELADSIREEELAK